MMNEMIAVAMISFLGTVVGSLMGVLTSAKLTTYRIEQLEKKVEKHNSVVEKVTALTVRMDEAEQSLEKCLGFHGF